MSSFIDTDPTLRAMQFTLDGLAQRSQVASNNVTNADTPNFKSSIVTFEDSLRQALAGDTSGSLPLTLTDGADINPNQGTSQAAITETQLGNLVNKNDGNNVDIEGEMTTLAQSNIMYDAMVQLDTAEMAMLKASVSDVKP
ncbi:MAG: flagellar basal body rod protein FlgB [Chloroflexota bacterium]